VKRIVVGNWKMHETSAQASALAREIVSSLPPASGNVTVVLAPPFTSLPAVSEIVSGTSVALGAQTMHWAEQGAFTGEISAPMLLEFAVRYVILGHSERRRYCGESDIEINRKVHAAFANDLIPIVAVGETAEERDAGITDERVTSQIRAALAEVPASHLPRLVTAYEPVWAIGTGRNCDPAEANRVMSIVRGSLPGLAQTPLLYGGSITPANFASYLDCEHCQGGLVGGASIVARSFIELVQLAHDVRA
jgi:triosephosphate isomerase (TIM)